MESLDFEKTCRLCLNKSSFKDLSAKNKKLGVDYYFLLNDCVSVQAEADDKLPSKMCSKCEKLLISYYNFRNSVIENDLQLKDFVFMNTPLKSEQNKEIKVKKEKKDEPETEHNDIFNKIENDNSGDDYNPIDYVKVECGKKKTKKKVKVKKPPAKDDRVVVVTKSGKKKVKGIFQCDQCGKSFEFRDNLRQHKLTHNVERPYQCPICGKQFKSSRNLSEHKKMHAVTGRNFECNICQKRFFRSQNLRRHMLVHTGEKPHMCSFCGRSFLQQYNLSVHIRMHTGEVPYECDICHKKFTQERSMVKHKRTHTDASRQIPNTLRAEQLADHSLRTTGQQTDLPLRTGQHTDLFLRTGLQTDLSLRTGLQTDLSLRTGLQTESLKIELPTDHLRMVLQTDQSLQKDIKVDQFDQKNTFN